MDPTATYSDATQYADDVYVYENGCTKRSVISLPTSLNGTQVYDKYIKPKLVDPKIFNFYYNRQGYASTIMMLLKIIIIQQMVLHFLIATVVTTMCIDGIK